MIGAIDLQRTLETIQKLVKHQRLYLLRNIKTNEIALGFRETNEANPGTDPQWPLDVAEFDPSDFWDGEEAQ